MSQTQTVSGEGIVISTQQKLAINLTAPISTDQNTASISGYVSRDEVESNQFNVAYIIDTSGSMNSRFKGTEFVADQNNDNSDNKLIDGAIFAYKQLNQSLIDAGLTATTTSVIEFYGSARTLYTGDLIQDTNNDGTSDVNTALQGLVADGSTNFEAALQSAITFFDTQASISNTAKNHIFFISDGKQTEGNSYLDEVSTLLNTHNVSIRALGLGDRADMDELDFIDDGIDNDSAIRVLEPSTLTAGLTASPIDVADIKQVDIYLNQNLVQSILASDLLSTPVGLQYQLDLNNLNIGADDTIEARVIANDTAASSASATVTVTEPTTTTTTTTIPTTPTTISDDSPAGTLFLDANESFTLFENPNVFGAAGIERIKISGAAGAAIDQNIERVEFSEVLANYTLALSGNILNINLNGESAAKITIQGNGTELVFKDGSANLVLTGLGVGTLGGGTVNSVESTVTGATLDTFDTSDVVVLTSGGNKTVNISAIGVDNYGSDNTESAADGDLNFNFTQGSYHYTVNDFTAGDSLHFETGVSLSVSNSAIDGQLQINASDSIKGTTVQLTLTGISTALDSTIVDVSSFNNAFGATSLV